MPEGQYLGDRVTYNYQMDDGTEVQLVLDQTIATAGKQDLQPATTGDGSTAKPLRFEPRGVYWQGELNGKIKRKFLPCNPTSTLYLSNTSTELTVDGVPGQTTGRRGEKLSFPKLLSLAQP